MIVYGSTILVAVAMVVIKGPSLGSVSRYLGVAAVAQTILVGCALCIRPPFGARIATIVALPLVFLFSWHLHSDLTSWKYTDWRKTLHYIQNHSMDNQQIYVLGDWGDRRQYKYYLDKHNFSAQVSAVKQKRGMTLLSKMPQVSEDARYLWVIAGERATRKYFSESLNYHLEKIFDVSNSFHNLRIKLDEDALVGGNRVLGFVLEPEGK